MNGDAVITKYKVLVHPHQLQRGDRVEEHVYDVEEKIGMRTVEIDTAVFGEIWYRNRLVPVMYVRGFDVRNQRKVAYTHTPREFMQVEREASPAIQISSRR